MHSPLRRSLAAGTAAALALTGLIQSSPWASAAGAADATKAANFIVRNLPATGDGAGASMTAALGLATTGSCSYAPAARTLVKQIEKNAKSYLYPSKKLNQARAANMAITVQALGLNPKKFAGYNLVSLVTKGLPKDGQVGSSKSAFSQSLGIIALQRAGATIPVTLLTNLLGQQDTSGAFGYENNGFDADPDTTAMGILALKALGHLDPQVAEAVSWAKGQQKPAGYWENYSPVDSTGLLGSALGSGTEVTKAKQWLGTVQHSDGGFPNSLDAGTASDVMATANALYLITGKSALDASLNLGKCPKSPPSLPKATDSCTGVWVVVDRGNGQQTVRCATKYANGLDALKSAGFSTKTMSTNFGPFLCRIQKYPSTCTSTANTFWGYWSAEQKSDGSWGEWTEYAVGASQSKPKQGTAEGWIYGPWLNGAAPDLATPPKGYAASPIPTIAGTATVGQTLTATSGTWTPTPDSLSYQWYRSGKSISKATKATYTLTKSDAKKTITVKVTAEKDGYQTVSRTSAPTVKVSK
ncbi:MAG: hypothetical protein QM619_13370 [Micropruina sp.]|uniref:hypothetical protein n=1 Tax=Micropruina sp. TaxID=2737536 RepID=UPI0039E67A9F